MKMQTQTIVTPESACNRAEAFLSIIYYLNEHNFATPTLSINDHKSFTAKLSKVLSLTTVPAPTVAICSEIEYFLGIVLKMLLKGELIPGAPRHLKQIICAALEDASSTIAEITGLDSDFAF